MADITVAVTSSEVQHGGKFGELACGPWATELAAAFSRLAAPPQRLL
jgi:hypothetical protein